MKKGQMSTLVVIIVALAGLIIMGYSLKSIANVATGTTDKQVCKQSIELRATTKLKLLPETQALDIPIKCKSQSKFIKNENDFKKANEIIANDMYDCWDQFGQGKLDFLFDREFTFSGNGNSYCFVCSKINFDDSIKNKNLIGLGDYIKNQEIFGSGTTYANFLFPQTSNAVDFSNFDKFTTNKPLYVIYWTNRQSKLNFLGESKITEVALAVGVPLLGCGVALLIPVVNLLAAPVVCTIGAAGGGAALIGEAAYNPTTTFQSRLIVGDNEEIIKQCQQK